MMVVIGMIQPRMFAANILTMMKSTIGTNQYQAGQTIIRFVVVVLLLLRRRRLHRVEE